MMMLDRLYHMVTRGRAWVLKRDRRLKQWRQREIVEEHLAPLRLPPPRASWTSPAQDVDAVEGVYHYWWGYGYSPCPFDVVRVDGTWRHRLSGNRVECNRLLSFLEAEEAKRKYPAIFNPEVKSDS